MKKLLAFCLIAFNLCTLFADNAQKYVYLYHKGTLVFQKKADLIDSVAIDNKSRTICLFDKAQNTLYSNTTDQIDSIAFDYPSPQADVLDVVFNEDGSATDISPMHNTVEAININGLNAYTYQRNGRFAATFDNQKGNTATAYYKVNYQNNTAFKKALEDGHSLEAVFMMTETPYSTSSSEAKFFSSHQSGGTGFTVYQSDLQFMPNVTTSSSSKYINSGSGIVPQAGVFYHVIGVWNKQEEKTYVYVNGELKGTYDAKGNFKHGSSSCQWFGIGGDPNSATEANMSWNGDVVIARIYDKPLTANDVTYLWNEYLTEQEEQPNLVDNVEYYTGLPVVKGQTYEIIGQGFQKGDILQFISNNPNASTFSRSIKLLGTDTAQITIPSTVKGATYKVVLKRGTQKQVLGMDSLLLVSKFPKVPEINAHRGIWNVPGSAQNSRTSLRNAVEKNTFSSEIDIWLTSDDSLMVNHDASLNGVYIEYSTYEQVKNLMLVNGEKIPKLKDMLDIIAQSPHTRLVIEVKKHSQTARTCEAALKALNLVQKMGLQGKTEWVSFSLDACKALREADSTTIVAYINGDKSPAALLPFGINLDYTPAVYKSHPTWIPEAHANGQTAISWTLNRRYDIIESANLEADYLASDYPWWGLKIRDYYLRHQTK